MSNPSRSMDLLLKAAEALEAQRDPFSHAFLAEHNVTAFECGDLSDSLALGARLLVRTLNEVKAGGLRAQIAATHFAEAALT